jgi:hypothetical protein
MLANLLQITLNPNDQAAIDNINLYALVFLILAICALVITTIQISVFGEVGKHITNRIRE